jgi:DNA-binding ferritin-like protein
MNQLIAKFISILLSSRNQAQIYHWQSIGEDSNAKHLALGAYYEEIIPLVDAFVESYQGKFGIITGYSFHSQFREDSNAIIYFKALNRYVELIRAKISQESYLQNQIDEIVTLIQTTLYKLEYLK